MEKYGFSSFVETALKHSGKIAVLADSAELRIAHEYAVILARLRGVNARVFGDERAAVAWLEADPPMNQPRRTVVAALGEASPPKREEGRKRMPRCGDHPRMTGS